jgi:toxin ParE1/3/4
MHPLAFRPKVAVELEEAAEWYSIQKPGLGDDFLAHFWKDIDSIAEAPLRWPKYFGPVRRYVMSRFPYLIYYEVDGEIVRILRVVHASRDPEAVRRGFN